MKNRKMQFFTFLGFQNCLPDEKIALKEALPDKNWALKKQSWKKYWGVPGAKIGDGSVPESFITTHYFFINSISVLLDYKVI